jgi:hypothetical protein
MMTAGTNIARLPDFRFATGGDPNHGATARVRSQRWGQHQMNIGSAKGKDNLFPVLDNDRGFRAPQRTFGVSQRH